MTADLRVELARSRAQTAALEREIENEQRRRLEGEHRELVVQCRAAKEQMDRLRADANDLRDKSRRLDGEAENARRHVRDQEAEEPRAYNYPTEAAIEAWRTELEACRKALTATEEERWATWGRYEVARGAWLRAKDAFEALADRERTLHQRLQPQTSGITITVREGW